MDDFVVRASAGRNDESAKRTRGAVIHGLNVPEALAGCKSTFGPCGLAYMGWPSSSWSLVACVPVAFLHSFCLPLLTAAQLDQLLALLPPKIAPDLVLMAA